MGMYSCPHCNEIFEINPIHGSTVKCPRCGHSLVLPEESEELPSGTRLGGFEILKLIGRGGMGYVYLARQLSMKRNVALKVLLKSLTQDKVSVEQFLKEVRMTACMEHSNIVTAIDAGEQNGIYYLAMTYVDGHDLESVLDTKGAIHEIDALKYALKIIDALNYAWEKHKLLHRDIKPGNIMVNSDGEPFLMDMGIALHASDASKKQMEHVEGSPFYMSPEQTRGEPLDWHSDMYSLGASLYHMICGFPPYDADDVDRIIEMHSSKPFPDPKLRKPDIQVSDDTLNMIRRMMEKKPQDRFSSWLELYQALEEIIKKEDVSTSTRLLSSTTVMFNKTTKIPFFKLIASGIIVVALAMSVFLWLKNSNEKKAVESIQRAEEYIDKPNCNYNRAVMLFKAAVDDSSVLFVSKDILERANIGLNKIKTVIERSSTQNSAAAEIAEKLKKLHENADTSLTAAETEANNDKARNLLKKSLASSSSAAVIIDASDMDSAPVQAVIKEYNEKFLEIRKRIQTAEENIAAKIQASAQPAPKIVPKKPSKPQEPEKIPEPQKDPPIDEYKTVLRTERDRISTLLVTSCSEKNFDTAEAAIVLPESMKAEKFKELEEYNKVFEIWLDEVRIYAKTSSKVWNTLLKTTREFIGTKLKLPYDSNAEIKKFENGEIYFAQPVQYRLNDKVKIVAKIPLDQMEPRHIMPLLRRACEKNGGKKALFMYLLCNGEFNLARSMNSDPETDKRLSTIARAYIRSQFIANQELAKTSPKIAARRMEALKDKYEGLPEFDQLIEEFKNK